MSRETVSYLRVSSQGQVTNGDGLGVQRKKIQEFCKSRGWEIGKIYSDEGISGAVQERPGLLELLDDCRSNKIERIVIYKYDRISREISISLWVEKELKRYEVDLVSVVEPPFDMDDPIQQAFRRMIDIFSTLERQTINLRLKDGRINNVKKGKRGCGRVPYGYVQNEDRLDVSEDEAKWVKKIYRWRSKGFTLSKIVQELSRRGAKNKRGKQFNVMAIRYILNNALYWGETSFGDIKNVGEHEPIISKRLFMSVERRARGIGSAARMCDS